MGTRSYIARQIGDDQYLTIYCQLNGYPEDTGATLVKHYDTSEKVNALLALGDLYYLREKLSPDPGRHDFIAPQPGVTLAYRRDGDCPGWEATIKTFEELYDAADWAGIEYIYSCAVRSSVKSAESNRKQMRYLIRTKAVQRWTVLPICRRSINCLW